MIRLVVIAATATGLLAASPALAGNGNILYILQDSTVRPDLGNEVRVDQSGADYSLIGTALEPATQKGAANEADLTITGAAGTIQLLQDNSAAYLNPIGNTAVVSVDGVAAAAVAIQEGDGNTTTINVSGLFALGSTTQLGDLNDAELFVEGPFAAGTIVQNGDDNEARLTVGGYSAVTYIQNGDGLSYQTLTGTPLGATVWSNAGPVLITQSSY